MMRAVNYNGLALAFLRFGIKHNTIQDVG
jgi:hypothetical protein